MKVSKREAFLLFFVGLLAICGAMYMLVIKPMSEELNANKNILSNLESQKTMVMATLPNISNQRSKLSSRFTEVSVAMNKFEQPVNEAEFERWVLPLTTKYNMKILETKFLPTEVVIPSAIDTLPTIYSYELKTLVEAYNNYKAASSDVPLTKTNLLLSKHYYKVSTTYARYVYMLDEAKKWETSVFITFSSYDFLSNEAEFEFSVYAVDQLVKLNKMDYTGDFKASGTGTGSKTDVAHEDLGK